MVNTKLKPAQNSLREYIYRLADGQALLEDNPRNLIEVVGVLKSYGVVLDAYSRNLVYIAEKQIFVFFPFFKYFNGEISWQKLLAHWQHKRINYEYAEYCLKSMFWHGGGELDAYLDSPEFSEVTAKVIAAKFKGNFLVQLLKQGFQDFLPEHIRQMCYYSGLGQFWRVMSELFLDLSECYEAGKINSIAEVVEHILEGLVAAANEPITYGIEIKGQKYEIIPESAGITFLADTGVPYVEAIFFRGTPFLGTVSYNAQAYQIPYDPSHFTYGALYADPLPIGGAGIPPTLLMQDIRHFLPEYLQNLYRQTPRGEDDIRVQICQSFQKSMFCVTSAAIRGLAPYPWETENPHEQKANRDYLEGWLQRLKSSRLADVNQ